MSNLVQEIHSIIQSQVRSDWMHIVEGKLAQVITAQVHLVAVWDSLDNKRRAIILEKINIEITDICTMVRGRSIFADDDQNGQTVVTPVTETLNATPLTGSFVKETDDYLILATELREATSETLVAALVEIATNYADGKWSLLKLVEAIAEAKKKIEADSDQARLEQWAKEQDAE